MILKQDQWTASAEGQESTIRGAINFRRVPNSSLYALSQPSQDGIDRVLETVRNDMKDVDGQMTWINLREEPLIYVNGTPYVLRLESVRYVTFPSLFFFFFACDTSPQILTLIIF